MKERIEKLITVKSIVTLFIVGVYGYLAVSGKVDLKGFESIVLMIMAFYFGTQLDKQSK